MDGLSVYIVSWSDLHYVTFYYIIMSSIPSGPGYEDVVLYTKDISMYD